MEFPVTIGFDWERGPVGKLILAREAADLLCKEEFVLSIATRPDALGNIELAEVSIILSDTAIPHG